jgi:hypothetical protein
MGCYINREEELELRKVTLEELRQLALNSKESLWQAAHSLERDIKLYLHWSAGHYGQFFDDYHINIDQEGSIYISTEDLSTVLAHTWHRNTGAVGIALACCAGATTNDLGPEPPTTAQIEVMAQVVSVLAYALDLTIDLQRVMTHGEAGDNMDGLELAEKYGMNSTCERWDAAILHSGDNWGSGGEILRGKAILYQNNP